MKQIIKNALILTAITLVSGLLLGLVYEITKEPIAQSKRQAKLDAYAKVLPKAEQFEELPVFPMSQDGCRVDEVVEAKSNGQVVGYIVTTTTSEGYGGDIQISVGFLPDGTTQGIAILSIGETVGLGMNATKPEFYEQFSGKRVESFQVSKNGADEEDEIDALSGATITSKAVTNAVNTGIAYFNEELGGNNE